MSVHSFYVGPGYSPVRISQWADLVAAAESGTGKSAPGKVTITVARSGDVGRTNSSGRLAEPFHLLPRQRVSKLVRSYERDRWQGS
jgi:hypothetical protein